MFLQRLYASYYTETVSVFTSSNFFSEFVTGASMTPNELFVASLILRSMQVLQFNAHEVQIQLNILDL